MKMMIINKDYSLLWCGQLVSQLGNRIYLMALAWYFVAVLGNGSGLFMLFMVSALPPLLFGVAIGPMVEKWNKRHTVITCDILSGILVGILATAVMTGNAPEWLVYVVCFILNTVNLFFSPSVNVMLPSIVGKDKVQKGEYYTEQFREQTAKRFGHSTDDPFVVWTGYGSADTGLIGAETTATIALRKFFFHHPELSLRFFGTESTPMLLQFSDECRIEIVDGQIVCTKNQFFPLIRYNTKDSGILLSKCDLHDIIPDSLYATLPDEILCVMGRVDNQIVFYGTNLNVNDIAEHLLTLPSDYGYGGLYTVQERIIGGVQTYHFVFYVKDIDKCASAVRFLDAVVDYARGNNAEFNYKYGNLTQSATVPLLSAEIADIKSIDPKVKHKYIIK